MPEAIDQGSGQGKGSRTESRKGLLQSLRDAHEVDHKILEALGIKHPHVPILSVIEMLDHLRDKHVNESHEKSAETLLKADRRLPRASERE